MTRVTATRPASDRPSSPRPKSAGAAIDPIRVLRQHFVTLLVTILVGCGLGVAAYFVFARAYPLYYSEVRFLLKPTLVHGKDIITQNVDQEDTVVRLAQTEAARIQSRKTLEQALRGRDIQNTKWGQGFVDRDGKFVLDDAVDEMMDDLRAGHRRGSQIFFIAWRAHDPADVPVVLNRISETYIQQRKLEEDQRYNQTYEVFRKQQEQLDAQLLNQKKEVADFIAKEALTVGEGQVDLRRQEELRKLGEQMIETKQDFDIASARKAQNEAKLAGALAPSPEDIRKAEEDSVLLTARRDNNDYLVQLNAAKESYGPEHSQVKRFQRLYDASNETIKNKLDEIMKRNLNADHKELTDKVDAFQKTLERQQGDYTELAKKLEVNVAKLTELAGMRERQKQLEDDRKEVTSLLTEINLVKLREDASRVQIVQPATTPRDLDFPNMKVMIPITALLTLAVVLVFIFTREFLDQRVKYTSDLVGLPGGRLLGVIPEASDDPTGVKSVENVVRDQPRSILAESFRQTAVQIRKGLEAGHKVIGVLCGMPDGGATTVTSNLAAVAAAVVGKVLVIDANFRRPRLGEVMGVSVSGPGLGDVLGGSASLAQAVQSSRGVDVLHAGTQQAQVLELLSSVKMDAVIKEAREKYDIVLIDVPPSVVAGEAITIANKVDATLLVVRAWQDQRGLVARLVNQLLDVRSVFLGVLLNRPKSTAGGYFRKNAAAMAQYAKQSG